MKQNPRLIMIANRLPVNRVSKGGRWEWESSAGGLVTAVTPVLKNTKGAWVGWNGTAGSKTAPFRYNQIDIQPVALSRKEIEGFYSGMSNKTLWPLYHDAIRTPEFHRKWWRPYCAVNHRFAKTASGIARKGDTVWVHDYHLQLVPGILRAMRPDLRIGFFLHIPFPPEELFEWLPWREDILKGLLGADLVGFQTVNTARNFVRLAKQYTSAYGTNQSLRYQGREVRVGAFPISIDTSWWEDQAKLAETARRCEDIRRRLGRQRKLFLAIDRLDYTKGIGERLKAFEELISSGKLDVDRCVLVQIAVPSREGLADYSELRTQVEHLVGRVNGRFSEPGRVAVHYFRRNVTREDLVAYYRAADVMLVTPLRDGMNLVAKEYVACRVENDGVLVLSQFTGSARELTRALIVNPRDTDQMMATILRASEMGRGEATGRMSVLRSRVRRQDVHEWARSFLGVLNG